MRLMLTRHRDSAPRTSGACCNCSCFKSTGASSGSPIQSFYWTNTQITWHLWLSNSICSWLDGPPTTAMRHAGCYRFEQRNREVPRWIPPATGRFAVVRTPPGLIGPKPVAFYCWPARYTRRCRRIGSQPEAPSYPIRFRQLLPRTA